MCQHSAVALSHCSTVARLDWSRARTAALVHPCFEEGDGERVLNPSSGRLPGKCSLYKSRATQTATHRHRHRHRQRQTDTNTGKGRQTQTQTNGRRRTPKLPFTQHGVGFTVRSPSLVLSRLQPVFDGAYQWQPSHHREWQHRECRGHCHHNTVHPDPEKNSSQDTH